MLTTEYPQPAVKCTTVALDFYRSLSRSEWPRPSTIQTKATTSSSSSVVPMKEWSGPVTSSRAKPSQPSTATRTLNGATCSSALLPPSSECRADVEVRAKKESSSRPAAPSLCSRLSMISPQELCQSLEVPSGISSDFAKPAQLLEWLIERQSWSNS